MSRPKGAKNKSMGVVCLVTEQRELVLEAPLDQVLSAVKQDDIRSRFGGKKLIVMEPLSELVIEERNESMDAAADLIKQGWPKARICRVLGLSLEALNLIAVPTEQAVSVVTPIQPRVADEPVIREIPVGWQDETRITILRGYVKTLVPDEDVSKWNKDACRATLNKILTRSDVPQEEVPTVEEPKQDTLPWEDTESKPEVEVKVQEEVPFVPPPLPIGMPQTPLAPPPVVPPPLTSPATTSLPSLTPTRPGFAPPPIPPSPFRR